MQFVLCPVQEKSSLHYRQQSSWRVIEGDFCKAYGNQHFTQVVCLPAWLAICIMKSSPNTGLVWPRGFQEVKITRFHDNGTGRW
jgi:hypothetical protein